MGYVTDNKVWSKILSGVYYYTKNKKLCGLRDTWTKKLSTQKKTRIEIP